MSEQVYYEVTHGEPLEFCRDWRVRAQAVEKIYRNYAESKGGIGFVRHQNNQFGGVIFSGNIPLGWKKYKTPCRDGTYFYKPTKRGEGAQEGKILQTEIDQLPKFPSDEEFLERFGLARTAEYDDGKGRTGTTSFVSMFSPVNIAWINECDSFWIVLPDFAARAAEMEGKGYTLNQREWIIPDGLKRSSRSRYELAQAADKVEKEEVNPASA